MDYVHLSFLVLLWLYWIYALSIDRRIDKMATQADLDQAIADLGAAITTEAQVLSDAIAALNAKIGSLEASVSPDLSTEVAALRAAQARILALAPAPTPVPAA
jgi:predicted nucleic acid-binding protein